MVISSITNLPIVTLDELRLESTKGVCLDTDSNEKKFFNKNSLANKTKQQVKANPQKEFEEAKIDLEYQDYCKEEAQFHLVKEEAQIHTSLRALKVKVISKKITGGLVGSTYDTNNLQGRQPRHITEKVMKQLGISNKDKNGERTVIENGVVDSYIQGTIMAKPYDKQGFTTVFGVRKIRELVEKDGKTFWKKVARTDGYVSLVRVEGISGMNTKPLPNANLTNNEIQRNTLEHCLGVAYSLKEEFLGR